MPRALFIVEDDVDDLEFYYAYYRLKEAGFEVYTASHAVYTDRAVIGEDGRVTRERRRVKGKRGMEVPVDLSYRDALEMEWDVLVLPGGRSPERARQYPEAIEVVKKLVIRGVPVLAICHGPQLLISAGIARGRRLTGYWGIRDDIANAGAIYVDEDVVVDGSIVTVRHTRFLAEGLRAFMKVLAKKGYSICWRFG